MTFAGFPRRALVLGIALTTLLAVGSIAVRIHLEREVRALALTELQLERLAGTLLYLDEVLTMSARMASETADPAWEARYREHEPELHEALADVARIAPDAETVRDANATAEANALLMAMENEAFDLLRQGRALEARAVFDGEAYRAQKQIYSDGLAGMVSGLRRRSAERVEHMRIEVIVTSALGLLLLAVVIAVWLRVGSLLRRFAEERERGRLELETLNTSLRARDAEREANLADLRTKHEELRAAHATMAELQARMVAQEKLSGLGLLAAGVAHEINNPMSFVRSNVELLLEELRAQPALDPALREYVDEVLPETLVGLDRMASITGDLRRFARTDEGEVASVDLDAAVSTGVKLGERGLKEPVEVHLVLGGAGPIVGRQNEIIQVVVNLVVNAAQALEGRGTVRVETALEPEWAVLRVIDEGRGMDEATRVRVFEPFFTTKTVGEGTGLGLSVVHGIVTAYGGRIEVRSAEGRGTTIEVRFPRAPQTLR